MKPIFLFLFLLFLNSCTNNELAKGYIYDKEEQAIDSVKVMVNGTDIYTYSNKEGYFEIDTKGLNDELLFDKKGFALKFEKRSKDNSNLKVILE